MPLEFTLAIATNPLIYKGENIVLAANSWLWYNSTMESRDRKTNAVLAEAWVKAGGEITKIAAKKMPRHSLRTKSHQIGGLGSRYLSGGTRNYAGRSRKAS